MGYLSGMRGFYFSSPSDRVAVLICENGWGLLRIRLVRIRPFLIGTNWGMGSRARPIREFSFSFSFFVISTYLISINSNPPPFYLDDHGIMVSNRPRHYSADSQAYSTSSDSMPHQANNKTKPDQMGPNPQQNNTVCHWDNTLGSLNHNSGFRNDSSRRLIVNS